MIDYKPQVHISKRLNFHTLLIQTLNLPAISSSCAYLNYNFEALFGELFSFGYLNIFKNLLFLYSGLCLILSGIKRLLNQ